MSTPDPEETEREALVDAMERVVDTKLRHLALNPGWGEDGTAISGYAANIVAGLVECSPFAARRLSESEIRRDQADIDAQIARDRSQQFATDTASKWADGTPMYLDRIPAMFGATEASEAIMAQFPTPSPEEPTDAR